MRALNELAAMRRGGRPALKALELQSNGTGEPSEPGSTRGGEEELRFFSSQIVSKWVSVIVCLENVGSLH